LILFQISVAFPAG